ncbi:MAG: MMPL family transporter [Hymenobacteraceae bacterium]|nr:MMPL family transporter [Hymenobacteraceae bacterium]
MAFGGAALWRLRFNYNFNDFYPQGDPELAYYERYIETFGTDNDYILVGLEAPGGRVFTADFLNRVDSLTRHVRRQRHVRGVVSPTTLTNPVLEGGVAFAVPYLHPAEPARLRADSTLIRRTPELHNTLFSTDYRAVALLIQTDPELGKPAGDTLLDALTSGLRRLGFAAADTHVAGRVVAQTVFVERLQWELVLFISLAVVLVTGLLWLTFRTWWGVVLPLLVVLLAIVWGLGAMGLAGGGINLLTALLPTMLFVVGMSDVVHILTRYGAELRSSSPALLQRRGEPNCTLLSISPSPLERGLRDEEKRRAVWVALREAAFGSGLSSLTTSIGFFTLATSNIRPIQDFGIFTGLAILLTFVLAFTLLPALLLLLPVPPIEERALTPGSWDALLRTLFHTVLRRRRLVMGVAAMLLIASVAAIPRIRLDATLLDDLAKDDPVRMDFDYFDQRFGGIRPLEMHLVPQGGRTVLDSAVVRQIARLETYLTTRYEVRTLASPATLVRAVRKAQAGGLPDAYRLPTTPREWRQTQKALRTLRKRPEFAGLLTPDGAQGRLTGRLPDIGSAASRRLRPGLDSFLRTGLDTTVLRARLTGSAPLLDANNDTLTVDMLAGVSLDIVLVILITLALFRSWRMVPVVLVPNLFPLVLVAGVMGAFDINLKVSTSIIFTIAFGIAVDDTIHFIAKLRLALRQHVSVRQAVLYTYRLAGQAVIVTALILIGGFGTLLFSSFDGTYYTGLLIGLTLLIGVVAELTLLPILILTFLRKNPTGWRGWRRRARVGSDAI